MSPEKSVDVILATIGWHSHLLSVWFKFETLVCAENVWLSGGKRMVLLEMLPSFRVTDSQSSTQSFAGCDQSNQLAHAWLPAPFPKWLLS